MINRGNTCYFAAVAQALARCASFVDNLARAAQKGAALEGADRRALTLCTNDLVRQLVGCRGYTDGNTSGSKFYDSDDSGFTTPATAVLKSSDPVNPGRALQALFSARHGCGLRPGRQNDAHELLSVLLDVLDREDLQYSQIDDNATGVRSSRYPSYDPAWARKRPAVSTFESSDAGKTYLTLARRMEDDWRRQVQRPVDSVFMATGGGDTLPEHHRDPFWRHSWVSDVFAGQYISQVKCGSCGYTSHTGEVLSQLPVDVHRSIKDAARAFFEPEAVPGWRCDRCNKMGKGYKLYRCWRLPMVLAVVVRRFDSRGRKDCSPVRIDDALDLRSFAVGRCEPGDGVYDLVSVVYHSGTVSSGHYVAVCKDCNSSEGGSCRPWTLYDDQTVRPSPFDPSRTQGSNSAYVLIYEKRRRLT